MSRWLVSGSPFDESLQATRMTSSRCLRGALLAGALAACADSAPDPNTTPPPSALSGPGLEALGYTSWDPDADPELSAVTLWDRERAEAGLNVFADDDDQVHVMDMAGRILHSWRIPGGEAVEYGEPLPDGGLVAVDANSRLVRLERDSTLVWSAPVPVHHDVELLPGGEFLAPFWELVDYRGRRVRFDGLAWFSSSGEVRQRWWTHDHLEELQALHPPFVLDTAPPPKPEEAQRVFDYYHLNTVERLAPTELGERDARFAPGNLLLCLRNLNLLLILEPEERRLVWHWRPEGIDFPHRPTLTPAGTLLIFDNGTHRGWSRVLELDPIEQRTVWEWSAEPRESFFSEWRGSAQRLPGGNTLVCESERGHVFELTPEGELVWEFWNPELRGGERRRIYRMLRFETKDLPWLER